MIKRWMMKKGRWSVLLLAGLALSCSKTYESSIPYRPVDLRLDLQFEDKDLNNLYAHKIFTQGRYAGELTGFGGVLVYHGADGYYAFEIACPYEADRNTTVVVDDDGIFAVCPKCQSRYELLNGFGNRVSGPAQYDLKRYSVWVNGKKILVKN